MHVFPFSPRPQTPAARMPPVGGEIIKQRARRLRALGDATLTRHLAAQKGKTLRVLAERGGVARAEDFTLVRTPDAVAGEMIDVTIAGHDGKALMTSLSPRLSPPPEKR
jgi:threonylcarbamoyladenosine tRNA methylthiotransferase MtaB